MASSPRRPAGWELTVQRAHGAEPPTPTPTLAEPPSAREEETVICIVQTRGA